MFCRTRPDCLSERRVELYRSRAATNAGPSDFERAFSSCRMRDSDAGVGGGAVAVAFPAAGGGGASDGDWAAEAVPTVIGGASEEEAVAVPKGLGVGLDADAAAVVVTPDGIGTVGTDVGVPALELPAEEVRLYKKAEKAVLPGA